MQQRTTSLFRSSPDQPSDWIVDLGDYPSVKQKQPPPPRMPARSMCPSDRFVYDPENCELDKRQIDRSRQAEKWVHAIPVLVLLCLFILWWFSYPVNLVFLDGRLLAVDRIETQHGLNNSRVDLAILASAKSPVSSVFLAFSRINENEAPNDYLEPDASNSYFV